MASPIQILPVDARACVQAGSGMLVCAYDNDDKFNQFKLEDAVSLSAFTAQAGSLDKNKDLIFYCN